MVWYDVEKYEAVSYKVSCKVRYGEVSSKVENYGMVWYGMV